ncbi:MAG: 3-phosphoshikimate 1-carboxyvinyltransferase [Fibrobacter sp.]|jgi:3-phosphoshikimate 1-carboxyvinyltransferase|nr:3-phosphoshikimate 1-carboxyvinyltransferase [Fibrobacter sp.]
MNFSTSFSSSLVLPAFSDFSGVLKLPGSKSLSNRALLLAALAKGETKLYNLLKSDDTRYMCTALKNLNYNILCMEEINEFVVQGSAGPVQASAADLYLGNAGTAIRSLCAALTLGHGEFRLSGEERMTERPIKDLVNALVDLGANIQYEVSEGYPPIIIRANGLRGGTVKLRGDISSQFLTALLISGPYAQNPLHIVMESELISKPYIDLTIDIMAQFGVEVEHHDYREFIVPKGVYVSPQQFYVEGDASSASYPLAGAAITGGTVRVEGVGARSKQGDVQFAEVLQKMGATIKMGEDWIECTGPKGPLKAVDLDLNHIPDAAMTVAVLALFADGVSTIRNIGSWRVKETDRIAALSAELQKVGATVYSDIDSIQVTPPQKLKEASIETYNDHRIAMCFSLVSLGGVSIKILDPSCVNKTYPQYFQDFLKLAK